MKCLILSGPPGAGKTTFGQLAAERWGWEFLEKDRLAPLPDRFLLRGTKDEEYRRKVRPLVYQHLAREVSALLSAGKNVVVEAPLLHEIKAGIGVRDFVANFPPETEHLLAWITCQQELQYKRRMARGGRQDRHLSEHSWEEYLRQNGDLFTTPPGVLVIENNSNSRADLQRAACQLDDWAKGETGGAATNTR